MDPVQIINLANKLREAKFAYYHSTPIMSDDEFDALETVLKLEDPQNPVLSETGAPANLNSVWPQATHSIPMTSLSKAMNLSEFQEWWNVHGTHLAFLSEKLDGLSLALYYEKGDLVSAVVRGDGNVGDNITPNAIKMAGVILHLKEPVTCSVRGEILMTKASLSQARLSRPEKHYANTRNTASGLARERDGELANLLTFMVYDVEGVSRLETETLKFSWLSDQGFTLCPGQVVFSFTDVKKLYDLYITRARAVLAYDIDGLVIRVMSVTEFADAGLNASGRPIKAIALKFPPRHVQTKVQDIVWEEGNSGRLTPVAKVEPVECDGAIVRNVSLHSLDFVLQHQVTVGAEVLICRAGDIIPYLVEVLVPGEPFWK
jgi:DNA ligase (NAD+)